MASGNGRSDKSTENKRKSSDTVKRSRTTTGSRTTSGSSRKTGRTGTSGKGGSRTRQSSNTSNQLRDEIVLLIAFAATVILVLSNFGLAGSVGKAIKWFMFGLVGIVEYILPIVVMITIFYMLANKDIMGVIKIKSIAVYTFCLLISALWMRITNKPEIGGKVNSYFLYCAENKTGGGLLGGLICFVLSPVGAIASVIILIILMIICIIIITERSFISGIRDGGSKFIKEAKEDYSAYKEHSSVRMRETEESEEEFRLRREEEKSQARIKKLEKKEKAIAMKKAKEEAASKARMNNIVRGVTKDLTIEKNTEDETGDINIHEIKPSASKYDEYSDDIYDPNASGMLQKDESIVSGYMKVDKETGEIMDEDSEFDSFFGQPDNNNDVDYQAIDNHDGDIYDSNLLNEDEDIDINEDVEFSHVNTASDSEMDLHHEQEEKAKKIPKPKPYRFPPLSLLSKNTGSKSSNIEKENRNTAIKLKQTLQSFGVKVEITDISCGPSVTRYELLPEQGVKVSKIVSLSDDIKLNLAAADIRIEAPIPGKAAIGIEVPNKEAGSVFLRELLENDAFKNNSSKIAFAAGKDIAGKTIVADIAKMPHLLIAGATGSGKSVCINTIIMSILYKAKPDEVKMIMVDPKVVELSTYNGIPHLLLPVVTDPKKAAGALNWAVNEMTDRYKKFAALGVRNLTGYNAAVAGIKVEEGQEPVLPLPQIVIIVDELADLMMVAPGEVEDAICRLAQLARAAGIHMVIATQRPSVNVITGLIKANVPSRIAFSVSSGVDSRTILDMNGAEKLLGKGDMLYFPSNIPKPIRVQGAFVSDKEVENVVNFLKEQAGDSVEYDESIANATLSSQSSSGGSSSEDERDSLFAEAGRFVIEKEKGSIGMLQRQLKIGFNRAGRIMDQLAEAGVVGPELGTKPRKVIMTPEEFENYLTTNNS